MIKIYGMPTCPYCDYVHEQIAGREDEFEYINIGENIRNMSAFTRLRDTSPVLITARKSEMSVFLPLYLKTAGYPWIRQMQD